MALDRTAHSALTVLVVDDNQDIRDLITLILADAGISAISAPNGDTAISLLEIHPVDLVLLDVMMPGKNGHQILSEIRHSLRPKISKLPVILISAKSQSEDVNRGLSLGANSFIVKPFKAHVLLHAIAELFDQKSEALVTQ